MSQSEVERFVADLKEEEALRNEATASATGVASVVAFAQSKGYDITADEARAYIRSLTDMQLSNADLDVIAGGKGTPTAAATQTAAVTSTVEAVMTMTTEAATAETTIAAAAETMALGAAAAVAIIVIVAT